MSNQTAPVRLLHVLRKITYCQSCGDPFEQNTASKRTTCPGCRLVNTSKGGKR